MYLYLVQWGEMSKGKPPFQWRIKKSEYVWADDKDTCRKWAIAQERGVAVRTEEVFAALKVPEMDIYQIIPGAKI
jgi:hypothetical protein